MARYRLGEPRLAGGGRPAVTERLTYSQAYRAGLAEEMTSNDLIFVLGTDILLRGGHFAQVFGLGERFGADRIRDVPISEAAMVAAGVGAALGGMRPVVDLNFLDFAFGGMDELCNQAAKIHYMFGIPVLFLMHKALTGVRGEVGGPADYIPFGLARIVREGGDATLIGYGATVRTCVAAAEQLAAEGVSAEVIDLRTLYPLDLETVTASLRKTGRAVMVDESPGYGGVSAEIAASLSEAAFDYLDGPVMRVHAPHSPVPQSRVLLEALLPGGGQVAAAARALMARG